MLLESEKTKPLRSDGCNASMFPPIRYPPNPATGTCTYTPRPPGAAGMIRKQQTSPETLCVGHATVTETPQKKSQNAETVRHWPIEMKQRRKKRGKRLECQTHL